VRRQPIRVDLAGKGVNPLIKTVEFIPAYVADHGGNQLVPHQPFFNISASHKGVGNRHSKGQATGAHTANEIQSYAMHVSRFGAASATCTLELCTYLFHKFHNGGDIRRRLRRPSSISAGHFSPNRSVSL
jgi:hypothetical protein